VVSFLGPAAGGVIEAVVRGRDDLPSARTRALLFVQAAFNRDYTMIMGTVLFDAVLILMFNLLVDVISDMA